MHTPIQKLDLTLLLIIKTLVVLVLLQAGIDEVGINSMNLVHQLWQEMREEDM